MSAPAGELWPDWSGEACAIVASGPSVKAAEVAALEGRLRVIAIKRSVELAPFADAVYGCDRAWWRSVRGLPQFGGLKLCYEARTCAEFGLVQVKIPDPKADRLLTGETGAVGGGGNSGFQALNLALQFGARRILLVGFDFAGEHWYGRNMWSGSGNPAESNFKRWRKALDGVAGELAQLGAEVFNASPASTLKAFPRRPIGAALEAWGL